MNPRPTTSRSDAPSPIRSERLPAAARLRTQQHFRRVYQRGRRAGGKLLTVIALRRSSACGARVGLSVSKDHGCAVRRNKIKRLLREAFRLERKGLPLDYDVVLIPRPRPEKLRLHELRAELLQLIAKIAAGKGSRRRQPHR